MDSAWRSSVEQSMDAAGLRHSLARATVLDWIAAAERPFTAEAIVRQLAPPQSTVSRPTIYRTVELLRATGWLTRLHGEGVDRSYVRTRAGSCQVICIGCGGYQAMLTVNLIDFLAPHLAALGFDVSGQNLAIYGRCRDCLQQLPLPLSTPAHAHDTVSTSG
jgi:Fur family ferric uptake transcriptional regulator